MNFKRFVLIISLTSIFTACSTTDPYTREKKTSNTTKGAGIGAVVGGIAGALANKDNRGKGALIGAAIGAGAGVPGHAALQGGSHPEGPLR